MKFVAFIYRDPIFWKLKSDDSFLFDLQSMPEFCLVNPLFYSDLLSKEYSNFSYELGLISETEVLMQSYVIIFGTDKEEIEFSRFPKTIAYKFPKLNIKLDEEHFFNKIAPFFEVFCSSAKEVSKQVTIPNQLVQGFFFKKTNLPEFSFPAINPGVIQSSYRKYDIESAISWAQVKIIDENIVKPQTPIYIKLFLDALKAYKEMDYKKCLLYSSMTIEILAKTSLDEQYKKKLVEKPLDSNLRIRKIVVNAKKSIVKDPVFEFLRESSKFSLKSYFHEIPLYLLDKSLQIDDKDLFDKICKLINTRNSIAHSGEPQKNKPLFYESEKDALDNLKCVLKVFQWFGEPTDFPLPTNDWVNLDFGSLKQM